MKVDERMKIKNQPGRAGGSGCARVLPHGHCCAGGSLLGGDLAEEFGVGWLVYASKRSVPSLQIGTQMHANAHRCTLMHANAR